MDIRRIAVLVDGDNVSARHSARVLSEAGRLGRIDIARVYAAANPQPDWLSTPGYRFIHAGEGKNAADLLLSIDAMEMALVSGLETFAIATSDGDFTHLVQRLRERGVHVLGLGEAKAPTGFRMACSEFLQLQDPESRPDCRKPDGAVSEFDQRIRGIIAKHSTNGRGMRIADLSPRMYAEHGTRISTFPEKNWRAYLSARPVLYEIDPRGPEAMVRFLPAGFAPH